MFATCSELLYRANTDACHQRLHEDQADGFPGLFLPHFYACCVTTRAWVQHRHVLEQILRLHQVRCCTLYHVLVLGPGFQMDQMLGVNLAEHFAMPARSTAGYTVCSERIRNGETLQGPIAMK